MVDLVQERPVQVSGSRLLRPPGFTRLEVPVENVTHQAGDEDVVVGSNVDPMPLALDGFQRLARVEIDLHGAAPTPCSRR